MTPKKVVVLGAGFAGLQLAGRIKNNAYDITVIDQYNFHQFQPLFYEVATARLEPSAISFPLRKIFQGVCKSLCVVYYFFSLSFCLIYLFLCVFGKDHLA